MLYYTIGVKQRMFLAMTLPATLKQHIARWQQQHRDLPIRYILPKNLHVTLIPPWYGNAKKVMKLLKTYVPKAKPFLVNFHRIIPGPTLTQPRLLWIEGKRSKPAVLLKRELEQVLKVQAEKRAFIPHITLARIKQNDKKSLCKACVAERVDWSMHVTTFSLLASHLSPKGANYEELAKFSL